MTSLAAVAGVTALVGVLNKVGTAMRGAIDTYAGFEKIEITLGGVMKNLGNTKKASDEFIDSLRKLSNETTFGYDTLASAAQQMLTVGVSTEDTKKKLIQLGNAAGGNTEKFNRLAEVYTKILSTGKAGAMQVQQLSMITGTSFVNALGKTSASAKEVTEQLEKMTEEGGILAGAMDTLNDTIVGKQDFVSDSMKELVKNFAEASGMVDMYKAALDGLKNILGNLITIMEGANKSPLVKALLSGTIAAALTAIVTIIGVSLYGAIVNLNQQLAITATLKALINPQTALIGLGIAAAVGTTVALVNAWKDTKDAIDEAKKAQDEFNNPKRISTKTEDVTIRNAEAELNNIVRNVEENQKIIAEHEQALKTDNLKEQYKLLVEVYGLDDEDVKKIAEEIDGHESVIRLLTEQNERYEERSSYLRSQVGLANEYKNAEKDIAKIVEMPN